MTTTPHLCRVGSTKKALGFIAHRLVSSTRHGVHSPFVYGLIDQCIYAQKSALRPDVVQLFEDLKQSTRMVQGDDLGRDRRATESIGHYAKASSIPTFQAELLFRIAQYFESKCILELGTNLGKSLAAFASVHEGVEVLGVEGNGALAAVARENLLLLNLHNAKVIHASFDQFLLDANYADKKFDLVFLDGDHRYAPTIKYIKALVTRILPGGVIVLHDIHWSAGMAQAWREVQSFPEVTVTVDLYWMGLVFINRPQAAEHFSVRFPLRLFDLL